MRVFKPVVLGVSALVIASFLIGLILDAIGVTLTLSAVFYLFLCFAQMLHSLEEYLTQFWVHIANVPCSRLGHVSRMQSRLWIGAFSHSSTLS